jgi:hypothetical protein
MASSPAALYDNQRNMRNIDAKLNERGQLLKQHEGEMYINEITEEKSSTRGSKHQ